MERSHQQGRTSEKSPRTPLWDILTGVTSEDIPGVARVQTQQSHWGFAEGLKLEQWRGPGRLTAGVCHSDSRMPSRTMAATISIGLPLSLQGCPAYQELPTHRKIPHLSAPTEHELLLLPPSPSLHRLSHHWNFLLDKDDMNSPANWTTVLPVQLEHLCTCLPVHTLLGNLQQ